ncbi:uncharacterized protein LOC130762333 [Actinidia eriantha]|uniref:uncharacterized protein LOC130762333 n=1 Tax=Actinidia eriantha TaxID=165200 RepID=UPI00258B055F|nr:uncharacterized protein LOC130762333 [Actinidia eriantha]
MSPGGKLSNRISSKSSSSEKQQSLNPELTCFPIEEDPSISGDNENSDEVADTVQEDIYSTVMSCGGEREPLTESTEACEDPSTSVTTIERFPDRSSLDSINTEVSISGTRGRVKQKHENRYSSKRRCTNVGNENRTLSTSTNCTKKATKSLKNRFSKPKVSRKTSLRNGGQSLSEKVFKHNNIVSNITSFVPLVQQKQAAAVVTGKRDIKVKALEAAEAAKRLEEKRQKEREMKKEALKVERARIGQENLRQIELKKKKKEEEQKKKDAVMAARKRLREEDERKEKERKRKRIDEARQQQRREQEEKLRVGKVEKGVPLCATDENVNNGKVSGGESRKHQIMVKERGDNNIVKKQQTEPRVAEISTSNVRQAVEDSEAVSRIRDTWEVNLTIFAVREGRAEQLPGKVYLGAFHELAGFDYALLESSSGFQMLVERGDSRLNCKKQHPEPKDLFALAAPNEQHRTSAECKKSVALVISSQQTVDPDAIFPPESFCSMDEGVFAVKVVRNLDAIPTCLRSGVFGMQVMCILVQVKCLKCKLNMPQV